MTRCIAVVNQKGGVGKTTTTVNVGAALAEKGMRTLLIDIDPQGNLSTHLGLNTGSDELGEPSQEMEETEIPPSIYEVLKGQKTLREVISSRSSKLDIVQSSLYLSAADLELGGVVGRELILKRAIDSVRAEYDYILIDCPPALGLLSLNALAAAESVIVPVQSEYLALHGVRQLLDTIDQVRQVYNAELSVGGVLICMHDNRKRLGRAVSDTIRNYFGELVFSTVIRQNVALAEAPAQGQTIFEYSTRSTGAEDYLALVEEIVDGKEKSRICA
ncbi:ParA family protein [bacterium]|nr:ParA family protein [bacterium]